MFVISVCCLCIYFSIVWCLDVMYFRFVQGSYTIYAFFLVKQLQEKFGAKSKQLYQAFIRLKETFLQGGLHTL